MSDGNTVCKRCNETLTPSRYWLCEQCQFIKAARGEETHATDEAVSNTNAVYGVHKQLASPPFKSGCPHGPAFVCEVCTPPRTQVTWHSDGTYSFGQTEPRSTPGVAEMNTSGKCKRCSVELDAGNKGDFCDACFAERFEQACAMRERLRSGCTGGQYCNCIACAIERGQERG
jgi:hypothetical protein